jgi:hypothetical protein
VDPVRPGEVRALYRSPALYGAVLNRHALGGATTSLTAQGKLMLRVPHDSGAVSVRAVLAPRYRTGRWSGHQRIGAETLHGLLADAVVASPGADATRMVVAQLSGLPAVAWYHGDSAPAARKGLARALAQC